MEYSNACNFIDLHSDELSRPDLTTFVHDLIPSAAYRILTEPWKRQVRKLNRLSRTEGAKHQDNLPRRNIYGPLLLRSRFRCRSRRSCHRPDRGRTHALYLQPHKMAFEALSVRTLQTHYGGLFCLLVSIYSFKKRTKLSHRDRTYCAQHLEGLTLPRSSIAISPNITKLSSVKTKP